MQKLRGLLVGYALIGVVCGWPLLAVVAAGSIAAWNGCTLHEGNPNPCVVNGTDIGETLYAMGVSGWFLIATIPIGIVAGVSWTVGWLLWRVVQRRKALTAPHGR